MILLIDLQLHRWMKSCPSLIISRTAFRCASCFGVISPLSSSWLLFVVIYCNYYCYYTLPSPSPLNLPLGQALSMRMLQGAKVCIRLTSHLPLCVSGLWNVPQVRRTRDPSQVTAGAIQSLGSAIIHSIPLPAPLHPEGARCIPVPTPHALQHLLTCPTSAAPATSPYRLHTSFRRLQVSAAAVVVAAARAGLVLTTSCPF